jgi:hypothetical protein
VVFDEAACWQWEKGTTETMSGDFDIEYTPAVGSRMPAHTATAQPPASPETATCSDLEAGEAGAGSPRDMGDMGACSPESECHAEVDHVPLMDANTPSAEECDTPLRRYRTVQNIGDVLDEKLLLAEGAEPATLAKAQSEAGWRAMMEEDMAAIVDNDTWELCNLPAEHRPICLKWVYKLKKNPAGEVVRHKARLV